MRQNNIYTLTHRAAFRSPSTPLEPLKTGTFLTLQPPSPTLPTPDYQEDRKKVVEDFNEIVPETTEIDRSVRRALFCIFDGHGGDACSDYLYQVRGERRATIKVTSHE